MEVDQSANRNQDSKVDGSNKPSLNRSMTRFHTTEMSVHTVRHRHPNGRAVQAKPKATEMEISRRLGKTWGAKASNANECQERNIGKQ